MREGKRGVVRTQNSQRPVWHIFFLPSSPLTLPRTEHFPNTNLAPFSPPLPQPASHEPNISQRPVRRLSPLFLPTTTPPPPHPPAGPPPELPPPLFPHPHAPPRPPVPQRHRMPHRARAHCVFLGLSAQCVVSVFILSFILHFCVSFLSQLHFRFVFCHSLATYRFLSRVFFLMGMSSWISLHDFFPSRIKLFPLLYPILATPSGCRWLMGRHPTQLFFLRQISWGFGAF